MNVLVLGSGVVGLTSAIRLQDAGFSVRIVTAALPSDTTSAKAAAIWYPYKAYPQARVLAWSKRTLDVFYDLAANPATGVSITSLFEGFDREVPEPWWIDAVRTFRRPTPAELPPGYSDGYVVDVPMIEAPFYLNYLLNRFVQGGGEVETVSEKIENISEVHKAGQPIVNCTGLGARALMDDNEVYPIRGQVVRVANPGLGSAFVDDYGPNAVSYIFPRSQDCVLGGTAEEHDWHLEEDPATTQRILDTARQLEPALYGVSVLDVQVGLRPARYAVRLEQDKYKDISVIHNYGHGGAGFTLSWGCADEVLTLLQTGL